MNKQFKRSMTAQEALEKIEELKQYVESLDKRPVRVRAYIKEDAKEKMGDAWNRDGLMDNLLGSVVDVEEERRGKDILIDGRGETWIIHEGCYIIVEGSLEDLK